MKKVLSIILCSVIAVSCLSFSVSAKNVKVKAPKLKSVTQTDLKTAKITWSKVSGAKGYVLYYSTNGRSYKKAVTTTKISYTHKKLTDNKKYYYKVRAYKKINGKTKYSKFSNIKTIRIRNDLLAIYQPYKIFECKVYNGNNKFSLSGNTYNYGILIGKDWSYDDAPYIDFNLKGKYRYIEFTFGDYDMDNDFITTLEVNSDDETVASYTVKPGDIIKTVKVDIENTNKLEFKGSQDRWLGYIGIVNIKLYK